jgi:hypothetical protein
MIARCSSHQSCVAKRTQQAFFVNSMCALLRVKIAQAPPRCDLLQGCSFVVVTCARSVPIHGRLTAPIKHSRVASAWPSGPGSGPGVHE